MVAARRASALSSRACQEQVSRCLLQGTRAGTAALSTNLASAPSVLKQGTCLSSRSWSLLGGSGHGTPGAVFVARRCYSAKGGHVVKTPAFGAESITEGNIMEWKVKVGDVVKKGDLLAMIETDKVTVEVMADAGGTVMEIHAAIDATVEVNSPLCTLQEGGTASAPSPQAEKAAPAAAPTAAPAAPAAAAPSGEKVVVKTPAFGAESITEGNIMEWKVKVGDFVKKGDLLVMIETDKVTVEVMAENSGTVTEIKAEVDATVEVGHELCTMTLGGEPPAGAAAPEVAAAPAPTPAAAAPTPSAAPTAPATPAAAAAAPADNRAERRVRLSRMRKTIANNLKGSQTRTAFLTTFQEVDMSGVMNLRKEFKDMFESTHGQRLSFMSPFIKASAFALQQIPAVNGVIDDKTNEIVYRDYIDISIAVATPRGLVTPVMRNVESMTISEVEASMALMGQKGRKDELGPADFEGGTFTISNGGTFGSLMGTPIINMGQTAVLGMHAIKNRPVVLPNGEIGIRPIMYLALTYDHRLVDGREAVTFLCTVRDQVEDPRRLLLSV